MNTYLKKILSSCIKHNFKHLSETYKIFFLVASSIFAPALFIAHIPVSSLVIENGENKSTSITILTFLHIIPSIIMATLSPKLSELQWILQKNKFIETLFFIILSSIKYNFLYWLTWIFPLAIIIGNSVSFNPLTYLQFYLLFTLLYISTLIFLHLIKYRDILNITYKNISYKNISYKNISYKNIEYRIKKPAFFSILRSFLHLFLWAAILNVFNLGWGWDLLIIFLCGIAISQSLALSFKNEKNILYWVCAWKTSKNLLALRVFFLDLLISIFLILTYSIHQDIDIKKILFFFIICTICYTTYPNNIMRHLFATLFIFSGLLSRYFF